MAHAPSTPRESLGYCADTRTWDYLLFATVKVEELGYSEVKHPEPVEENIAFDLSFTLFRGVLSKNL
jgi:hypothetical protein